MEAKASTGRKEGVFDNVGTLGYVKIDKSRLSPEHEYHMVTVDGNCMNSVHSPMRIRHGDKVLVHEIPVSETDIRGNIDKVVCFLLADGVFYVKQAFFYDGVGNAIIFRMFNPQVTLFIVSIDRIKALFVVDEVYSAEYVESHKVEVQYIGNSNLTA